MWIVLRLVIAVGAFLFRLFYKPRRVAGRYEIENVPIEVKVQSRKNKLPNITLRTPLKSPVLFKITPEGGTDGVMKALGLATEFQTGDAKFDESAYIASDHPFLKHVLTNNPEIREQIHRALGYGFTSIVANGVALEMRLPDTSEERAMEHGRTIAKLTKALGAALENAPSRLADPFLWRALVVEGIVWSIFGYALAAVPDLFFNRAPVHLASGPLTMTGLKLAGLGLMFLLAMIVLTMRGSSRGHRIIVESFLVLLIALPAAGVQAASDINRGLDRAPSEQYQFVIEETEERRHRRRRGRTRYTYHFALGSNPLKPEQPRTNQELIPHRLQVPYSLYARAGKGDILVMNIKPGRLNMPWYESLDVRRAGPNDRW
ncbi:MAG TPA: hypothetical protein VEH27_04870 [Methylomirabilota bacterium]|nr:hypothetical protein [Methylomirabilota bacterium]